MSTPIAELLGAFKAHSVEGIRAILDSGFDVRSPIHGETPVNALIEMYFRSDRFEQVPRPTVSSRP